MGKISRETKEMYLIYKGIGEFENEEWSHMTGDWEQDKYLFDVDYREIKKKIKELNIDTDDESV